MTKHKTHYLSLIGIMVLTIFGFAVFSYDKNFQLDLIIAATLSYFVWGIIHHFLNRDLSFAVIVEYIVFALLGAVIGISVIFRS